jgi:CDP-2,3-bis-(O-geranylgeranyl)-sn-glycerol synthase
MFTLLFKAFWFISPAMVSNMMPVWAKQVRFLDIFDIPIDGGRTLFGKPIFGRNKTVRGFIAGVSTAILVGVLQYILSENFAFINNWEMTPLELNDYLLLSALTGFGALLGDAMESLLKRQIGIAPGNAWFPFDQLDYLFGALLLSTPVIMLNFSEYLAVLAVGFALHPTATFIGYKLGLKDKPI